MNIVFIVYATPNYRIIVQLIHYCLLENFNLVVFQWKNKKSPKFGSFINADKIKFKYFNNELELNELIENNEFDFIISLNPITERLDNKNLKKISNKYCIIMHGDDNFLTVRDWKEYEFKADLNANYYRHFFVSNYEVYKFYLELIKKYPSKYSKNNYLYFISEKTKIYEIGDTQVSNKLLILNKYNVRNNYNIPTDKKIMLYLPFPFLPARNKKNSYAWQIAYCGLYHMVNLISQSKGKNKLFYFLKFFYYILKIAINFTALKTFISGNTEKELLKKLKEYCDKNNYFLIAKPKSKYTVPSFLEKYTHLILNDEQKEYYPSLFQKLLYESEYTISYYSTSIKESCRYKTLHINITLPEVYFDNDPINYLRYPIHEKSMYNFNGVIENLSVKEFKKYLTRNSFDKSYKVKLENKNEYIKKFINKDNEDSGIKFINFLKKIKNFE